LPDAVIIGAGIIGCAAGEALARQGAAVTFIDPRGIGGGATQASAGMLTPYTEGRHSAELQALGLRSLELWDAFVERLGEQAGSRPTYGRTGSLDLALDEVQAEALAARAHEHAAFGIPSTYLTGADARRMEPAVTPACAGALLVPAHGYASASDVASALWQAAARRGARMVHDAVTRISSSPGGAIVETTTGRHVAGTVVLCAGSWAGGIAVEGARALPVRPVRGQLVHLRTPAAAASRILWGPRCYIVPWADGTILVGATVEEVGFDERPTAGGARELLDAAIEVLPDVRDAGVAGIRAGLRPATPDELPVIGRSTQVPGLIYATGHYRNGVLLAPLTADLVAEIAAGREPDPALAALSPQRFGEC
jgi:glycine oxidase